MYRTYVLSDFLRVKDLSLRGLSSRAIAKSLDMPRSTVENWRRRSEPPATLWAADPFEVTCEQSYAYLLGAYLGDGYIWQTSRRSWRFCVTCDAAYPGIIDEVSAAIHVIASKVCVNCSLKTAAVVVAASSPCWPQAFPQHGPGRKHERPIVLEPWQLEITSRHPQSLLRGLIHSDGCRCVNRFRTRLPSGRVGEYAYPRYFFSNLSADIRRIFSDHCDLLGILWTQSNTRNISVAHRSSVAAMDAFIGPKR